MSRDEMLHLLDVIDQEIAYGRPYMQHMDKLRAALSEPKTNQCGEVCERAKLCAICAAGIEPVQTKKCKYGDQSCPCQDGDMCHYEGPNPMTPPAKLTEEEIEDIWRGISDTELYDDEYEFARAIERQAKGGA